MNSRSDLAAVLKQLVEVSFLKIGSGPARCPNWG
jgi:hypothetical protein